MTLILSLCTVYVRGLDAFRSALVGSSHLRPDWLTDVRHHVTLKEMYLRARRWDKTLSAG